MQSVFARMPAVSSVTFDDAYQEGDELNVFWVTPEGGKPKEVVFTTTEDRGDYYEKVEDIQEAAVTLTVESVKRLRQLLDIFLEDAEQPLTGRALCESRGSHRWGTMGGTRLGYCKDCDRTEGD